MSPSPWAPFLVKSEKWALTGCDLAGLFQTASLGWSEFSHRLCLFLSGDYKERPAQMWVFTHADCGCPLTPPGLSSLLRQPVSFSFIPNFSLEIAIPKPTIPIMQDVGGLNLPCGCMRIWAVLQGKGPRTKWDAAFSCNAGPVGSGIPRALWEAGVSKHWKQSQTFLNSLTENFCPSRLFKCHLLCITNSFALQSCRKIACIILLHMHTPKSTQAPCENQLEISKGQRRTKNNKNNRKSCTLVYDVKKRCLPGNEAEVVWLLSLPGHL